MSSSAAAMNSLSCSAAPNKKANVTPPSWLLVLLQGKERSDFAAHCLDEISAYLKRAGHLYSCHRDLSCSDSRHLRYVPDFEAGIPGKTWHEALKRGYWRKNWDTKALRLIELIEAPDKTRQGAPIPEKNTHWGYESFPQTARITPKPWGQKLTTVSLQNCSSFGRAKAGESRDECHATKELVLFCPALKSLDLSGTSITHQDLEFIGKSETLTHLNVSNTQLADPAGRQFTQPLRFLGFGNVRHTLESLTVRNAYLQTSAILDLCGWDDLDIESGRKPKFGCCRLTALDVSANPCLANGAVLCISQTLAGLRSLNLSANPNISLFSVQSIFGDCGKLTQLNLEGTGVDPADCRMLAVSEPKCQIEF